MVEVHDSISPDERQSIPNKFGTFSSELQDVLKSMLKFHPHHRLATSELLNLPIFDQIRNRQLETIGSGCKIHLDLDIHESTEYGQDQEID